MCELGHLQLAQFLIMQIISYENDFHSISGVHCRQQWRRIEQEEENTTLGARLRTEPLYNRSIHHDPFYCLKHYASTATRQKQIKSRSLILLLL